MYPIVYIPSEDFSRFQGALNLANQTLKLDAGRGDICPATTKNARKLKQLAEEGVLLAYGQINLMQRIVSLEELRCEVDDTWNRLLQCFADEAKYRDLVTELRQIFRQHYILKYVTSTAEAGRESIRAFCGSKPDDLKVDCVRTLKSPSWAQIISGMDEERPLLVSWQDALRRHALAGNPGPPPPRPSTPSTDMAKAVAGLFCEDGWHAVWDAGCRGELFELIAENIVGRRRHPYFNRYTDYLMVGNFKALANIFYFDKLYLKTRLGREDDSILHFGVDIDIGKTVWRGFRQYQPDSLYDDYSRKVPLAEWQPTDQAVQMSIFQRHWESPPVKRHSQGN